MALSFPLSHANWADRLKVVSFTLEPSVPMVSSGLANGGYIPVQIGETLWRAECTFAPMPWEDARQIAATARALQNPGASFFQYDFRRPYPTNDPTGSTIGSTIADVASVSGGKLLSLSGLPASYVITRGDLMTIAYGSSPTRYHLVEAQETVTANGGGTSPAFEVYPFLRAGIQAGNNVDLTKPYCLMKLTSFNPGTWDVNRTVTGMGFSAIEVRG